MGRNFSSNKTKYKNKSKKGNAELITRRERSNDSIGKINQIGLKLNQKLKSKGDNNHLPDKEIEIQKYPDKNGQYNSNVQHQQKIRRKEFILYSKEDMEILIDCLFIPKILDLQICPCYHLQEVRKRKQR
jgi:hypothetical protein